MTNFIIESKKFVQEIDSLRLNSGDKTYYWKGTVNGQEMSVKGCKTNLHLVQVDHYLCSGPPNPSVEEFRRYLYNVCQK